MTYFNYIVPAGIRSESCSVKKPRSCLSRLACISTRTRPAKIIYVGKAKSLRARVRSYFNEDRLAEAKTGSLISEARDVDYILVDNEKEALALENNLIKQYKPRYNVLLRDDKTYPYIKLTNERFPRVYVTRRLKKDGVILLRPVLSRQPRAPPGALHSPAFSGAVAARWISRAFIRSRACSTTFIAAWGRAWKA